MAELGGPSYLWQNLEGPAIFFVRMASSSHRPFLPAFQQSIAEQELGVSKMFAGGVQSCDFLPWFQFRPSNTLFVFEFVGVHNVTPPPPPQLGDQNDTFTFWWFSFSDHLSLCSTEPLVSSIASMFLASFSFVFVCLFLFTFVVGCKTSSSFEDRVRTGKCQLRPSSKA